MAIDETRGFKLHVRGDAKSVKDTQTQIYEQRDKHGKTRFYDITGHREISDAKNWERDTRAIPFRVSIAICKSCKKIIRGDIHNHVCEVNHGNG